VSRPLKGQALAIGSKTVLSTCMLFLWHDWLHENHAEALRPQPSACVLCGHLGHYIVYVRGISMCD